MNVDGVDADRKFVHDMKNLLGIIIGYSHVLLDETPPQAPTRQDIDEIRRAGEDAITLLKRWDAQRL